MSQVIALVLRGIKELKHHMQLLFVFALLVIFPLLFISVTESIFSVAWSNIATVQKQQVTVLHSAIIAAVANQSATTSYFAAVADVSTLQSARVIESRAGEQIIIASTDGNQLGQQDGSILLATAGATQGEALVYEFDNGLGREWHAYEQFATPSSTYYVITEYNFKDTDAIVHARFQQVYLGLSAIFLFLLALSYWIIRQNNWAKEVTALKKERSEQLLFTNTIAHELRAPLTVIKGYASLLSESAALPDGERDHVSKISSSTERLILLINDFLEVARIQSGTIKVTKKPVDITTVVQDVSHSFTPMAVSKGISISYNGPMTAILTTDAARLTQILTNLLSNAVKYTDKGTITIHVDQTKNATVIKIQDTGHGISAEDQRRLFAPFTRVGKADTSQVTGSGLGMWITQQLVGLLGGTVAIESIEGTGTVAKITLPR